MMIRMPFLFFRFLAVALFMFPFAARLAADQSPSVAVKTATVARATVFDELHVYGTLEPDPDKILALSLPHAGLINKVWMRLGQRVKSGDPLIEVVTAPEARMQYLQAESAVAYARQELQRAERLFSEQLATKAQIEAARKNLRDAGATLKALKERGTGIQREVLRAVSDGIVTRLDVTLGQRVAADTTAMLIAAENHLIARLGVEPEDLQRVRPSAPATIQPVFVPGVSIKTQVRDIHAMIDPNTHLVEVLAPIPDDAVDHLVLGSQVRARIQIGHQEALVVPRGAVLSDKGESYLFVVRDGKAARCIVTTGLATDHDQIAVSGGIQAGDKVVVSGNYELSDGMAVRESR